MQINSLYALFLYNVKCTFMYILRNISVFVLLKIILFALTLPFTGKIIKVLYENISYAVTNISLLWSVICCAIMKDINIYT